jgi:hypothetical protein
LFPRLGVHIWNDADFEKRHMRNSDIATPQPACIAQEHDIRLRAWWKHFQNLHSFFESSAYGSNLLGAPPCQLADLHGGIASSIRLEYFRFL